MNLSGAQVTFNIAGDNITNHGIINKTYIHESAQQPQHIEDIVPVDQPSTQKATIPAFAQLFTFAYSERRKSDFENMLALIQEPQWDNKDRARFALAIYQSEHLIPRTKPSTFKDWYTLCCNTFDWQQGNYEPRKLTPNEATRQILIYL
jgi:hypothetical protein